MKKLLLLSLLAISLTGCTTVLDSRPTSAPTFEASVDLVDKLTMTQHPAWRPDGFGITDKYLDIGLGATSTHKIGFVSSSSRTRTITNRVYYKDIVSVELLEWTRKFRTWYIVSVVDNRDRTHLFRTREKSEAQEYLNALNVIVATNKAK